MRGKAGLFSRLVPFSPASLEGLTGWWDASDSSTLFDATSGGSLVASDGGVARLEDKSGQGRHFTQSTGGNQPTRKTAQKNGLDVLRFDGTDDRMSGTTFSNLFNDSAATCFVVAKATTAPTNNADPWTNAAVLSEGNAGHGFFGVRSNSTAYSFGVDNFDFPVASLSYTAGDWVCFATDHDGSLLRVTVNKTSSATASLNSRTFTFASTVLGANYLPTEFFDGDVGEIITYNVALSATNRAKVETYLMDKWGIT
jgi:hypothetical protein